MYAAFSKSFLSIDLSLHVCLLFAKEYNARRTEKRGVRERWENWEEQQHIASLQSPTSSSGRKKRVANAAAKASIRCCDPTVPNQSCLDLP